MKKIILTILTMDILLLTATIHSYAAGSDNSLTSAYTTDASKNPKTVFDWNETPYLFSTFNFYKAQEKEVWVSPTLNVHHYTFWDNSMGHDLDTAQQQTFNILPNWDIRKETGVWTWFARANNGSANGQTIMGTFTVTPEPISSVLFLIGGGALYAGHNRRKKLKHLSS